MKLDKNNPKIQEDLTRMAMAAHDMSMSDDVLEAAIGRQRKHLLPALASAVMEETNRHNMTAALVAAICAIHQLYLAQFEALMELSFDEKFARNILKSSKKDLIREIDKILEKERK